MKEEKLTTGRLPFSFDCSLLCVFPTLSLRYTKVVLKEDNVVALLSYSHNVLFTLSQLATSHVDLSLVMFKYDNLAYLTLRVLDMLQVRHAFSTLSLSL